MRTLAVVVATVLGLAWAGPALASVGLPRLGEFRAGPHLVALYNDSPTLVTGRNTLTLELPPGVGAEDVRLELLGPAGQTLAVGMHPVAVLGAAGGDDHEAGDDHGAGASHATPAPAAPGHGAHATATPSPAKHDAHAPSVPAPATDHAGSATFPGKPDEHRAAAAAPAMLRGAATVPAAGRWRASLTMAGEAEGIHTADLELDAVEGGPNRLYVIATGSLMSAALLVGCAARHPAIRRALGGSTRSAGRRR